MHVAVVCVWSRWCDRWSTVIGIHSISDSRGEAGGGGGGVSRWATSGRNGNSFLQLSWNMTGCWWMKQEGRGAPVWQVVSGFMECLQRRAEQSGVPRNGHVFHLTLATWERLTFNFGFYICRWLQCVTVMHKLAPPSLQSKLMHVIWNGYLKRWKAKVWSWIAGDNTSLICFFVLCVYWRD